MIYPLYQEISYQDPLLVFNIFATQSGAIWLDSSRLQPDCGRYSYIGVDPFQILKNKDNNAFQFIERELAQYPMTFHPALPPFQGGAAGYLSYDLCHHLEKLPHAKNDKPLPDFILGFYDLIIAFDHELKKSWIFSSGYPCKDADREEHAKQRLLWLKDKIAENIKSIPAMKKLTSSVKIQSNFTSQQYQEAVKKVKNYILAGDIFEANISQCFSAVLPDNLTPFALYQQLRTMNPAPFAAYFVTEDVTIASASPERFLQLTAGLVEARPIKGTRPRGKNAIEDEVLARELLDSEKDCAENIMIVDLLRNDLSRVCEKHSVIVKKLCGLESYANVHHLVSVVQGKLQEQYHSIDLLRATFPGGSITGAPKIRAMEIIAEIEPIKRGPYCGSMVWLGFNGNMDSSILIRTYVIKNNEVTFQAGGAVVIDSCPEAEYRETLTKVKTLCEALQ